MYEFRPIADRIAVYREKVRNRLIIGDASKEKLKLEAEMKFRSYPPMLKKAYMSRHVIENMPIHIQEDEYFFGDMCTKHWGAASATFWLMADIEHTWPILEDGLHHAPLDDPLYSKQLMAIAPEELAELREITKKKFEMGLIGGEDWLPTGARDFFALQASDYGKIGGFPVMLPPGHLTPGFQTILKRGYADIEKQARDWLDAHEGNIQGDDIGKYIFYSAAEVCCQTATAMTLRYAELLKAESAKAADPERKAEYASRAESLTRRASRSSGVTVRPPIPYFSSRRRIALPVPPTIHMVSPAPANPPSATLPAA